jgi:ubiquitin-protein ligase
MSEIDDQILKELLIENPWRNVYWFSRMLINNDKYGAVGSDSNTILKLSAMLRGVLNDKNPPDIQVKICKKIIVKVLEERYHKSPARIDRVKLFIKDINDEIRDIIDIMVLILTIESVLISINNALKTIPNNDREFTVKTAQAYLEELGDKGLATVVNRWDDFGVEGCLTAERISVVREFSKLRSDISKLKAIDENETDLILTAFTQEFERRLGQKRKGRAGSSLEDVASFIFDFYKIKDTNPPEHFQADIEVDKWIKCKNGWVVGISCKRTLRERWKQVSSADRGILSKFKIRQIWHLVTYDEDLSDDKLTLLGSLGHVFYLRDESRKLLNAQKHIGMNTYVRPMSKFVIDLKKNQEQ